MAPVNFDLALQQDTPVTNERIAKAVEQRARFRADPVKAATVYTRLAVKTAWAACGQQHPGKNIPVPAIMVYSSGEIAVLLS